MDSKLKNILIEKILGGIPAYIKPVDYLCDILGLGRDSIYRRLKGQIDFSLDEIVILSDKLNFSLDEIHAEFDPDLAIIKFYGDRLASPEKYFNEIAQVHCDNQKRIFFAKKSRSFFALNRLLGIFHLKNENLIKFLYYRWTHQFSKVSLNYKFSDLKDMEGIFDVCEKSLYYQQKKDYVIILDEYILYNLIQEIKYYYERGLIEKDEIALIKADLIDLAEVFKKLIHTGKSSSGASWTIYLTSMNISANCSYLNYDNEEMSTFWVHSDDIFYSYDHKLSQLHKYWLESLKKYATLITQSNQKMQAEFINKQYQYLEEI